MLAANSLPLTHIHGQASSIKTEIDLYIQGDGLVEVKIHTFLTLALDRGEWQLHAPVASPLGDSHRYPLDRKLSGSKKWVTTPAKYVAMDTGCYKTNLLFLLRVWIFLSGSNLATRMLINSYICRSFYKTQ
jgi:hypothetical protein